MALRDTAREFLGSLGADFTSRLSLDWLRKRPEDPQPLETRKAVEVILELYPRVNPPDVLDDRVNRAEWLAGERKGDSAHIAICDETPRHEERNRRIREHIAARDDQVNLAKRHDRITWYEKIPDAQKRELELLHDATLKQLFKEDTLAERDLILKAVVDQTFLEKLKVAKDKAEQLIQERYGQLDDATRAALHRYVEWSEKRRRRREEGPGLTSRQRLIMFHIGFWSGIAFLGWTIARMIF